MRGYVYVLTNPAMPGLVKIGRSKHSAGTRAKQIYSGDTGVPLPFDVYFECLFCDCEEGEAMVHEELHHCRINPNREFFKIDPPDAQKVVMRVCAGEIDCTVVEFDYTVCEANMALVSHRFNLCPPDPYALVDYIPDSGWLEAIRAYKSRFPDRATNAVTELRLVKSTR